MSLFFWNWHFLFTCTSTACLPLVKAFLIPMRGDLAFTSQSLLKVTRAPKKHFLQLLAKMRVFGYIKLPDKCRSLTGMALADFLAPTRFTRSSKMFSEGRPQSLESWFRHIRLREFHVCKLIWIKYLQVSDDVRLPHPVDVLPVHKLHASYPSENMYIHTVYIYLFKKRNMFCSYLKRVESQKFREES